MTQLRSDLPMSKAMMGTLHDKVPLNAEEINSLFKTMHSPDSSLAEQASARQRVFERNMRLVAKQCSLHKYLTRNIPPEDVMQEACIGLMRAIDKFDHKKGFMFSTYACFWIKRYIDNVTLECGRSVRLPAHAEIASRRMGTVTVIFKRKFGREPSVEEMSEMTDISKRITRATYHSQGNSVSIQAPIGSEDATHTLEDRLECLNSRQDVIVEDREHASAIRSCLRGFSPREQAVMQMRLGFVASSPFDALTGEDIEDEDEDEEEECSLEDNDDFEEDSSHEVSQYVY